MDLANKLFKGDRVIWIIFMFLCLISVVEVFSATSTIAYKNANHWAPIVRHASFLIGGFVLILLLHNIPCRFYSVLILLLPVSIILLILTPYIGIKENEAHRWISLFGVQFQPSEFAKLACIVFVSFMLSRRGKFTENQIFYGVLGGISITCAFIVLENFSTAFMLFGVCFLMMCIGLLPWKKMVILSGSLLLLGCIVLLSLTLLPDDVVRKVPRGITWKERLKDFRNKDKSIDPGTYKITDENYQVSHAKIAVARGGVFGKLPGHGQQRDFLPQAYSDFIYAIIIEELGYVGGVAVLLLYIMLLVRVGMIARRCEKLFPKFLVLGCGLVIVVQALANMAVAVNLIPVTGQPLPLISRGGTSTIITCVYFGIILSVSRFGAGIGNEDSVYYDEEPTAEEWTGEAGLEAIEELDEIIPENEAYS